MARTIDLEERKQFRVLLNPVRQDIIHLLRRAGRPMTVLTPEGEMALEGIVEPEELENIGVRNRRHSNEA